MSIPSNSDLNTFNQVSERTNAVNNQKSPSEDELNILYQTTSEIKNISLKREALASVQGCAEAHNYTMITENAKNEIRKIDPKNESYCSYIATATKNAWLKIFENEGTNNEGGESIEPK